MKDLHGEEQIRDNGFDMLRQRENISEADLERELNFKTAVKGFNKKEVADYIAELNRGFQVAQAALTERVSNLSDEVAVLKCERERHVETIHNLKVQLAGGENNIDESYFFDKYKSDVDTLQNEKESLRKRNYEISEKYDIALKENDEIKQVVKRITAERDKLVSDCDELRAASVALSAQVDALSGQNRTLQNEKNSLISENNSLLAAAEGADSKENAVQAERDALAEKAKQMAAEMAAMKSKLHASLESVNLIKEENAELNRRLADAKNSREAEILKDEIKKIKLTNDQLVKELDAAKETREVGIMTLKQEIGRLTREKAEAEERIEELKNNQGSEVSARNYEIAELKQAYEKLEEKLGIVQRSKEIEANARNREITGLKKENAELKEKLDGMAGSDSYLTGDDNAGLKSGLFGKLGLVQKGRDIDTVALREEIASLKQANSELSTQLTKEKNSKETEHNTLSNLIADLKQENMRLAAKLEELKTSGTVSAASVDQIRRLAGERDTLLEQNDDYRRKIQQLENKMAALMLENTEKSVQEDKETVGKIAMLEDKVALLAREKESLLNETGEYKDKIKNLSVEVLQLREMAKKAEQMSNSAASAGAVSGKASAELLEKNKALAARVEYLQNKNDELIENINRTKDELYDLKQIINVGVDNVQVDELLMDDDEVQYVDDVDRRLNKL